MPLNDDIQIKGNIQGIRAAVLREMEGLFSMDMELLRHNFVSEPLLNALVELTQRCNREVMVYVARDGMVMEVIVGQHDRVDLPNVWVRRGRRRLTGVRCIHTHPGGDALLSSVDISALKRMRFDAMASIGVLDGQATGMEVGLIEDVNAEGEYQTVRLGPYHLDHVPDNALLERIEQNDERIARAARVLTQKETDEERAILVGMEDEDSLQELARLADTAGAVVLNQVLQRKSSPDPSYFIGQGKASELSLLRQSIEANLFIFDDELSGSQTRNLEEILGCPVVDRTTLILDIFAQRATTYEGRLQVELAQLKYRLPRLAGKGTALSRLGGGIGTRGPGETKIEVDRRRIRRRVFELEQEVSMLEKQRGLRRQRRVKSGIPTVALAGYTNAGKSTLLNALSGSDVLVKDMLFATLDPVTRRIELNGQPVLLTDTVGFIKKLPHDLVDAFRSTLEEALQADVIIHVVDGSSPEAYEQYKVAEDVLDSLGAGTVPRIVALNKCDVPPQAELHPESFGSRRVEIAAANGEGIPKLKELLAELLSSMVMEKSFLIPYDKGALLNLLYKAGQVQEMEHRDEGTYLRVRMEQEELDKLGAGVLQYTVEM